MIKIIKVADEFSRTPGGRVPAHDRNGNGQTFREEFLVPALNEFNEVELDFNGCAGLPSSFLEEAFGGLIRKHNFLISDLKKKLKFSESKEHRIYIKKIWSFINEASSDN